MNIGNGSGQEVTNGGIDFSCGCPSGLGPSLLFRNVPKEGGPLDVAAMTSVSADGRAAGRERAIHCARVALDNKAQDVVVLDMRGITPLFDFFVLATGVSRRQIHTLAEEIDAAMRAEGDKRLSIEGYQVCKWVVQDYGDVVIHVFDPEARAYYALEDLWADAPRLDWQRD